MKKISERRGFTLIELLVVIGIIAVLAGIVIVAVNPGRQFSQANNARRRSDVQAILQAIGQRRTDNKGTFETGCAAGTIPSSSITMATGTGNYNIAPCLVPTYLSSMPYDPTAAGAYYATTTDYNTSYSVSQDANGRVTVSAPSAQNGESVSYTQ